jgi:hypothetical protein
MLKITCFFATHTIIVSLSTMMSDLIIIMFIFLNATAYYIIILFKSLINGFDYTTSSDLTFGA